MQVTSYGKLLEEVEKLNQAEQLRLLEQIAVLIRSKATVKTRRSILEIQGMGKNISFYPPSLLLVNNMRKNKQIILIFNFDALLMASL